MNCKKWLPWVAAAALLTASLCGCANGQKEETPPDTEISAVDGVDADQQFTDRDRDTTSEGAVSVALKDNATAPVNGVKVEGNTVTIQKEGSYRLSGTLTDGRVVVDAPETAKIQLVLDGVSVTCSGFGALYVRQADKVFLTLEQGSENTLVSTAASVDGVEENVDGTLFSKDDLTLNGSGKLTVNSPGHGLVIKASCVITGGTYDVTAQGHAIQAKKDVRISDGAFTLTAVKDGIHVENPDNTEEGYLYVAGGTYTVTADGDGFSAATLVQVSDGTGTLICGGGAANGETHFESFGGGFGGWGDPQQETAEDDVSAKGIKGGSGLLLEGGVWTLDTADDALHSNGDLTVKGGTLTLSTGDDGLHADGQTAVQDGVIAISQSYEGIEGQTIEIAGGTITLTASDDGLNAAGGNDQSGFGGGFGGGRPDQFNESNSSSYIRISGGKLTIDASGDGVDSNGDLFVEGGETIVSGPTNGGNGALDYGGTAKVTGGILCAVGASGMAQGFTEATDQGALMVTLSGMSGGEVKLTDADGKVLFQWTPAKNYGMVALTCPGLKKGETYTLTAAGLTDTVEMTDWVYGGGGGMGGPGGMGEPGGMGGHGGGMRPGRR